MLFGRTRFVARRRPHSALLDTPAVPTSTSRVDLPSRQFSRLTSLSRLPHPTDHTAWYVGLDLSYTSPAAAAWHQPSGTCHLFYFAQAKHPHQQDYPCDDEMQYEGTPAPPPPSPPPPPTAKSASLAVGERRWKKRSVPPPKSTPVKKLLAVSKNKRKRSSTGSSSSLAAQGKERLKVTDGQIRRVVFHRLRYPASWTLETQRYAAIAEPLVESLLAVVGPPSDTTVWIEQYTFSQESSSVSGLCEFTGLVQFLLVRRGYHFWKLSNKTPKRIFGGTGDADKTDMFLACRRQFPVITRCLEHHFLWSIDAALGRSRKAQAARSKKKAVVQGGTEGEDNVIGSYVSGGEDDGDDENGGSSVRVDSITTGKPKKKSKSKLIPHPIDDIVDAFAILLVGMIQEHPPKTKEQP